jgi:hypothetical protein
MKITKVLLVLLTIHFSCPTNALDSTFTLDENIYLAAILNTFYETNLYGTEKMWQCMNKSFAQENENKKLCEYIAKRNITKITKKIGNGIKTNIKNCHNDIKVVNEETNFYIDTPNNINELKEMVTTLNIESKVYLKQKTAQYLHNIYNIEINKKDTMEGISTNIKQYLSLHHNHKNKITSLHNLNCENLLTLITYTKAINNDARKDFDEFKDTCKSIKELKQCTVDYYETVEKAQGLVKKTAIKNKIKMNFEFEELPKTKAIEFK